MLYQVKCFVVALCLLVNVVYWSLVLHPLLVNHECVSASIPRAWDQDHGGYHCFRDSHGSAYVIVHGYKGENFVCVSGEPTSPEDLVIRLLSEEHISVGEDLHIICCYPGSKVAGQQSGVKFTFVGDWKGTTNVRSLPGNLIVSE